MPDNLSSDSIDRRDFIGAAIGVSAALPAHFGPANAQANPTSRQDRLE